MLKMAIEARRLKKTKKIEEDKKADQGRAGLTGLKKVDLY